MHRNFLKLSVAIALMAYTDIYSATAKANAHIDTAEKHAISNCKSWLSSQHKVVDTFGRGNGKQDLICFDGPIDANSSSRFVELMKSTGDNPIVVIRSGGGEVNAGMNMGDAIRSRLATIIVLEKCLSSCANYILVSGHRRIVLDHSLLGFHGGVEVVSQELQIKELADAGFTDPKQIEASIRHSELDRNRQDLFLSSRGIKSDLYDKITSWNLLSAKTQAAICPAFKDTKMLIFDPEVLSRNGISIDVYDGPRSENQLSETLLIQGRTTHTFCYVSAKNSFF